MPWELGRVAALLLLATWLPSACTTLPANCRSIGASEPAGPLHCAAARGDKQAQLELAILYEEGLGVERSARRAADLYRAAASPSGGTIYVYSPPVGAEKSGRVMPVEAGPRQPGLPEAQYRLALLHLSGSGAARNVGRARRLLQQASRAGHAGATEVLLRLPADRR